MNKTLLTGLIMGLLGGIIIGFFVGTNYVGGSGGEAQFQAPPSMGGGGPIPGGLNQLQAQQRISATEAALAADPKNAQGWITLGNDYFDMHQAQKAVEAYGKALVLDPKGPAASDVLTDQGVMFRELKDFDKAIVNFKQANKLNPKHIQSLFNLGIVYSQDKHDAKAALQAWNKVIEIAPTSSQAEQAKTLIAGGQGLPLIR